MAAEYVNAGLSYQSGLAQRGTVLNEVHALASGPAVRCKAPGAHSHTEREQSASATVVRSQSSWITPLSHPNANLELQQKDAHY